MKKRKTIKSKICPNPLFEKWLLEWKDEANQRDSKLKFTYSRALMTLRKYPLPLKSGRECLILKYFGAQLCDKLDRKLEEHRKTHPEFRQNTSVAFVDNQEIGIKNPNRKKCKNSPVDIPKPKKMNKTYVPAWRSGAYAILLTLFEEQARQNYPGYMLKSELQTKAQPLCNVSLSIPDPGSHYTGWSSMATLKSKGLVTQEGNPARYSLTKEGEELAMRLKNYLVTEAGDISNHGSHESVLKARNTKADLPKPAISKEFKSNDKMNANIKGTAKLDSSNNNNNDAFCGSSLPDDLLNKWNYPSNAPINEKLSKGESCSGYSQSSSQQNYSQNSDQGSSQQNYSQSSSQQTCSTATDNEGDLDEQLIFLPNSFQVILLVDTAEVTGYAESDGDVIIKELKIQNVNFEVRHLNVGDFLWICRDANKKELVLPYIVERKRMDDCAKSITDGRFHEQKFRLKQSGLQNVIYLIEKYTAVIGLPINTLQQAVINTQIIDEFFVKITNSYLDTIHYLADMTKMLTRIFSVKMLLSCQRKNLSDLDIKNDTASLMTFDSFSKYSAKKSKNFKVGEMFIKHLVQIRGLTVEKAIAIVNHYPTPRHLISAYRIVTQGEMLLSDIKYGSPTSKRIGPHISKVLYQLYTKSQLT